MIEGWLNVDLLPHNAEVVGFNLRARLQFLDDDSIDLIDHEHFFEHLDRRSARRLLVECRRVMKAGGWMRISISTAWSAAILPGGATYFLGFGYAEVVRSPED